MRIAICDDVAGDRRAIAAALEDYLKEKGLEAEVERFSRPERLLAAAKEKAFDLYLLDVLLSDDMTGIELARQLRFGAEKVPVVFFSTSREYAVDAFAVEAISYLEKPWTKSSFTRVLDLATEHYRKTQEGLLAFRTSDGVERFAASQIEFVMTAETVNYVTIRRVGGAPITLRGSIRNFAEQYAIRAHLVPVGRSILLNPAQIASLEKSSVRFFSGETLEVPKSTLPMLAKAVLALSASHLT